MYCLVKRSKVLFDHIFHTTGITSAFNPLVCAVRIIAHYIVVIHRIPGPAKAVFITCITGVLTVAAVTVQIVVLAVGIGQTHIVVMCSDTAAATALSLATAAARHTAILAGTLTVALA